MKRKRGMTDEEIENLEELLNGEVIEDINRELEEVRMSYGDEESYPAQPQPYVYEIELGYGGDGLGRVVGGEANIDWRIGMDAHIFRNDEAISAMTPKVADMLVEYLRRNFEDAFYYKVEKMEGFNGLNRRVVFEIRPFKESVKENKPMRESIVNKMSEIINEGSSKLKKKVINEDLEGLDSKLYIQKDVVIGLLIYLIKNKNYRRRIENILKQMEFLKKNGLEDGYDLDSIKEAFKTLNDEEANSILKSIASINEGVQKMVKKAMLENEEKKLQEELRMIKEFNSTSVLEILKGYLEAALWTEEYEVGPASVNDISDESKEYAKRDVIDFISKSKGLYEAMEPSQVGHDLWLTRNGHGAGFWDRGLGEVGEKLSEIAREMGEKHLYRGDDGKIHID